MSAEQPEFEGYHVAMISVEKLNALETAARREQARVVGRALAVAVREAGRWIGRHFASGPEAGRMPANHNHGGRAAA